MPPIPEFTSDNEATTGEVTELEPKAPPVVEEQRPAGEEPGGEEDVDLEGGDEQDDRQARVDDEMDAAGTEEEKEAIRVRRRAERQNKKLRAKNRYDEIKRQLQDQKAQKAVLEKRLLALEQVNQGTQLAQINTTIEQAAQAEESLTQAHARALAAGDHATAAEATRRLIQLTAYRGKLQEGKEQAEQLARRPQQQHIDPDLVVKATAFRNKHKWFNGTNAPDPDSRVMAALDNSLTAEGWDPSSDAYWEELEKRGQKYLPERFKSGAAPGKGQYNATNGSGSGSTSRSPVAGGGSSNGTSQPGVSKTFHLNEARVKAMKDAGSWDDPKRKADMIKRYQEADKKSREDQRS